MDEVEAVIDRAELCIGTATGAAAGMGGGFIEFHGNLCRGKLCCRRQPRDATTDDMHRCHAAHFGIAA